MTVINLSIKLFLDLYKALLYESDYLGQDDGREVGE